MLAHKLVGNAMQMIVCQLEPRADASTARPASSSGRRSTSAMETRLTKPATRQPARGAGRGRLPEQGAGRHRHGQADLAGESLAFQYFTATGGSGLVAFAGVLPGEMRVIELDGTRGWFAEKDAFVAAERTRQLRHRVPGLQGRPQGRRGVRPREVHRRRARWSSPAPATSSSSTRPSTAARSRSTPAASSPSRTSITLRHRAGRRAQRADAR